ncbi:caspase family protein [Leptolyngbya ohadii]|uniref:caspase family protein n=1 Tax=Leptolyngbya ohadii TaxID=1962290 RepID=UPI000B59DBEB|nr:caspase family protein [Leptolyngbya ohadii]
MTRMKRRHFLQFAGSTLAAIGLSQADFLRQADRYGRALAQSTPRRLALLVGINGYQGGINPLSGCLTDVELQRQLLIHRFGFNPADILVVSDGSGSSAPPTRDNILRAFEEHLIKQAKAGDVVVFHYSGHGDRISDPNPLDTPECREAGDCKLNGTMVPMNAGVERETASEIVVPDIMGRTLFLLMSAVQTNNLTAILDSCHSGAGTRGNVVVRAANLRTRSGSSQVVVPSDRELSYQEAWMNRLNLTPAKFQAERIRIAKGVVLGSAQRNQLAIDATFDGFSAGGFSFLLTRYLWQMTGNQTAETVYANLRRSTNSLSEEKRQGATQVPVFEYNPDSNAQKPLYFVLPSPISSEAVITKADSQEIEFWLGGVSSQSLKDNGRGNVFTLLNPNGQPVGEIEQTDRRGLYGYGKLLSGDRATLTAGQLLREKVIGMPTDLTLKVGIDPSLEAEAAAVTAALAANRYIKVVPLNQGESIDYLLGRFTEAYREQNADTTELPPIGSVGLLLQDQTVALNRSFDRADESAVEAVSRLQSTFKLLLAGQLLQAIAATSSDLQIEGEVYASTGQGPRLEFSSRGAAAGRSAIRQVTAAVEPFKAGATVQFKVNNLEDDEVYLSCLAITGTGEIVVLFPASLNDPEEAARIDKRGSLVVPRPEDGIEFPVDGNGTIDLLVLVSRQPLRSALTGLQAIASSRGVRGGEFFDLQGDEPLEVIDELLSDVNSVSRGASITSRSTADRERVLDTNAIAAFSTVIEIVE